MILFVRISSYFLSLFRYHCVLGEYEFSWPRLLLLVTADVTALDQGVLPQGSLVVTPYRSI